MQSHQACNTFAMGLLLIILLGIAPNMMLAKVCSDKNKPNGQYKLPSNRQAVIDFIQDLPVRKVGCSTPTLKPRQPILRDAFSR